MASQADETLKIAQAFIAALSRRDPDTLIPMLADNVVMESAYPLVPGEDKPGAKICTGESVRAFLRGARKTLSKIEFTNVVWRTTNDGLAIFEAVGDLAYADGRPYRNNYLMMFKVANGKLVHWKEYFNPVIWARAFGAPLESLP
jgi:ketosteroid isomerase-like protein